jgi:hypothetical protein
MRRAPLISASQVIAKPTISRFTITGYLDMGHLVHAAAAYYEPRGLRFAQNAAIDPPRS